MKRQTHQPPPTAPASSAATAPPETPLPSADEWALPAMSGVQAGSLFFVAMVRMLELPRLFTRLDPKAPPEKRAQRPLNKARLPRIARYLLDNPRTYTLSGLAGAIDAFPPFVPAAPGAHHGTLHFPRDTPVSLLDGQHRAMGIALAIEQGRAREKHGTELVSDSIPVVLFVDIGLERSQQRFADLNRYAVRPNGSLSLLYDHRDPLAGLTRAVVEEVPVLARLTDLEKTSCADGSPRLFTLSAIHAATQEVLGTATRAPADARALAVGFWSEAVAQMRDWRAAAEGKAEPPALRRTFVHAHVVGVQAIGRAGGALIRERPDAWREALAGLDTLNWLRSNASLWEGRALVGGRMSKSAASVTLTANALKLHLGLELGPEERRLEDAHQRERRLAA